MVTTIKTKLIDRKLIHGIQRRRLPDIIERNQAWIAEHWLAEVEKDPELNVIRLSNSERVDHIPGILRSAVESARGADVSAPNAEAAEMHGIIRRRQGYTAALVVRETKLLSRVLAECIQQNLLSIQVSNLITDLARLWEVLETELEIALRAFLDTSALPKANPATPKAEKRTRQ